MAETLKAQFVCIQRMKRKENWWNKKGMKQDVGDVYAKNTLESNDRKFKTLPKKLLFKV